MNGPNDARQGAVEDGRALPTDLTERAGALHLQAVWVLRGQRQGPRHVPSEAPGLKPMGELSAELAQARRDMHEGALLRTKGAALVGAWDNMVRLHPELAEWSFGVLVDDLREVGETTDAEGGE